MYIMKKTLITTLALSLFALAGAAHAHGNIHTTTTGGHNHGNNHGNYNNHTKNSGLYLGASVGKLRSDVNNVAVPATLFGTLITPTPNFSFDRYDEPAQKVFAGYQFNSKFAVEAHHFNSDENITGNDIIFGTSYDMAAKHEVKATGLSLVLTPFNSHKIIPFAKIGVTRVKTKTTTPASRSLGVVIPGTLSSTSNTGISGGLGVMFPVNERLKLRAEYEKFDSNTDLLSVGASYHF